MNKLQGAALPAEKTVRARNMKVHNRGQLLATQGLQLHLKICNTSCTH